MAKDPAFLFYSQDFYTGVAELTFEERGQYISILCLMHQKGRMKEETIRFLVGSVSVNLKSKFGIDEDGLWFNKRLEEEISNRANFMEDENEIVNEDEIKIVPINTIKRKNEFLNNQKWKEEFCMAKTLQMPDLEKMQADFISDCDLKGEYVDSYKRYFTNWFNKKQHETHKRNFTGSGKGVGTSEARINKAENWGHG